MLLYVETSFAVGIAKGQDPDAAAVLEGAPPDTSIPIQIAIPSVCFMEALSVWELDRKQHNKFMDKLTNQLREVSRDVISTRAQVLVGHLGQSRVESEARLGAVEDRLNEALFKLTEDAEIISLDADMIRDSLMYDYLDDPTDNLILCCVLHHARLNPSAHKAFFSANRKDFGEPEVCQVLEAAGVSYFPTIRNALGWLRSRPPAES